VLLQVGQLLSRAGSAASAIAYPLLTLAVTGSPANAGIVSAAGTVPNVLFSLIAGVAADRCDRRRVMIAADAVRALALGALGAAVALDDVTFWAIAVVAFVEGSASAFFAPAAAGALRAVVPAPQLPAAAGVQGARMAAVNLAGPTLGGALFGLARALPFLADAVSYAFSTLSLLAMRTPFQEARAGRPARVRSQLVDGLRFLWRQPFLRTCAFLYGLTNFIGPGLVLAIVVLGERQGLAGGAIGLLISAFAACMLAGALASPLLRRALSTRAILLLELWAWLGCAAFVAWPNVYVLVASILPCGLAIPVTDSVVVGYRLAITPDRLLGRVESARSTIALLVAPLGPLVAGALLSGTSARATIAVFAGVALALALWGTLSPAIRSAPSLDELDASPA
jgi:Transmembrane secretion effector